MGLQSFESIKNKLMSGDINIPEEDKNNLTFSAVDYMNKPNLTYTDMNNIKLILEISNIIYNNSSMAILPLDDDMYDSLMCLYMNNGGSNIVGAPPVSFKEIKEYREFKDDTPDTIIPFVIVDKDVAEDSLFINQQGLLRNPTLNKKDFLVSPFTIRKDTSKKVVDVPHVYPNLVGTLNKTKIVLNDEAREKDIIDNPNIKIFERDFLYKHLSAGLFSMHTNLTMILELKYDGISVEAEVSDHVISARSRGDTDNDVAADLTPLLEGYPFKQAIGSIAPNNVFGMKFEAVISKHNLEILNNERDTPYKNARNAIIGLFGSLEGYYYRDFITLVPLATSLPDITRVQEIEFMNKYYHSGEQLRYVVIQGTYTEILYQVNKFVKEAEYMRPYMPYLYDGVVVSYADPIMIGRLGRTNAVNNYSIAIKFNPMKKETIFFGYDFQVGHTGTITPMINFRPLEFYGTIHSHESGHSFARFKDLCLRKGDIINVEYMNDVMAYVTKPDNEFNRNNPNPIELFPSYCPACGSILQVSSTGKRVSCENIRCRGRKLSRLGETAKRLRIKDFSIKSIKILEIESFADLMELTYDRALVLGKENAKKLISRIETVLTKPITDYDMMSALVFSNIAAGTWKLILSIISIPDIILLDDYLLREVLNQIKGIGNATVDTICEERDMFKDDILWIVNHMTNIVNTKENFRTYKRVIRFSGIRDEELMNQLCLNGYDASEGSVTKATNILIIPYQGYTSEKVQKALKYRTCTIVTLADFKSNMNMYL